MCFHVRLRTRTKRGLNPGLSSGGIFLIDFLIYVSFFFSSRIPKEAVLGWSLSNSTDVGSGEADHRSVPRLADETVGKFATLMGDDGN